MRRSGNAPGPDLRLVPAAVAAWGAAAVAVAGNPQSVRTATVIAAVLVILTGAWIVTTGRRRARVRAGTVLATAWLALVAAAVALASTAAGLTVRHAGGLQDLVTDASVVSMTGVVRTEPSVVDRGTATVALAADTLTHRGRTTRSHVTVEVRGGTDVAHLDPGARVQVSGQLSAPWRPYDHAARLTASTVQPLGPAGPVDRVVLTVRTGLREATDGLHPDARALVVGATLGDTRTVPPDLAEAMRTVSLTHVTAVSGAHLAVVTATAMALTSWLRTPVRVVLCASALTGFVVLVGPQPSVLRAGSMAAVMLVGLLVGRPSKAVPALATAALVLVVVDPWMSRSFGFVLSVLATASIVMLAPVLSRAAPSVVPGPLRDVLAVPVAAQLACQPVLVLLQPALGLYAVPANVLAVPALLPTTLLGLVTALVAPWAPGAAAVIAHGAGAGAWWIATVARFFAGLPGALIPWPGGAVGAALLALPTVMLVGWVTECAHRRDR
ncbi:ComEC/Rec2 family competence protein [Cellulomonas bogoriensis]|uniref:Competence protein ComEC n=1 Tax=Cellulomonas bogoriensis 69B4 = DSM 16987 TaxID=1386082 RepID=A0A0A0BM88_9CELL|nr:ComEC/Rec2 family competence protein [Cellulomonas bogoriensis]KGM08787.1 competence protein ComEC [Cellulomonas bogoriensis 69B4 = DSM 16987]